MKPPRIQPIDLSAYGAPAKTTGVYLPDIIFTQAMKPNQTIFGRHPKFATRGGFAPSTVRAKKSFFRNYQKTKAAAIATLDRLTGPKGKDVR